MYQKLKEKLTHLPKEPGVYLMKDSRSRIIYVGKATSLKSRVGSYFSRTAAASYKTQQLVKEIYDLEIIITKTDVEALLLERTMIKHHQPKFNILLRDDKEYPYLRIDMNETWPRIEKVRRRKEDGATYLGPFGSGTQLKLLMDTVKRIFPLVRCSRYEFDNTKRPCNYFHMKMCLAPCKLPVDPEVYRSMMESSLDFLRGKNNDVLKSLKNQMMQASQDEQYELAAMYRDQIEAYNNVTKKQSVVGTESEDIDAIGFAENDTRHGMSVVGVRDGFMVATDSFLVHAPIQTRTESMEEFIPQFYDGRSLPRTILVPFELPNQDSIRDALLREHPDAKALDLVFPKRGTRLDLLAIANKNATWRLEEANRSTERKRVELEILKDKLHLQKVPRRMECIDISNTQGTAIVASCVCFIDGKPARDQYRIYNIKTVQDGPDDFTSIHEVVKRRIKRGLEEDNLPDLLVIDGGRGQLSVAEKALQTFPEVKLDLVSLAKSKADRGSKGHTFVESTAPRKSFERVFFPGESLPTPLTPGTPEFRLMTSIRDEAHRFAITAHRKKRSKQSIQSGLEDIPGIGPVLRKTLLTQFGGIEGLRNASLEQLKKVKGLRSSAAVALHASLAQAESGALKEQTESSPPPTEHQKK